jgi:hypothetical protein
VQKELCELKVSTYICTRILTNDSVAQLVEQRPFKAWVLGSSPSGITENLFFGAGFFMTDIFMLNGKIAGASA